MITIDRSIELIQNSLDNLQESGMLAEKVSVNLDTVLLGVGATLDSLGFVTFVTDLEDRLTRELGREVFFVLDDIQDFNITNPFLSASVFANYMVKLSQG
jgi:acyl carrier protein